MLVYFVIIPLLIGILLYIIPFKKAGRLIAAAIQSCLFVMAVYLFMGSRNEMLVEHIGGFDKLLTITLQADLTASVFILLAAFIFLIAAIYSFNDDNSRLFWFLLFIWEGVLIGIFLTRDLFNIFVLLEVVTLAVAVMVMYRRDNRSMYDGIFYLIVNTVAAQFYLFGAGFIYKITGTFDIQAVSEILAQTDKSSLYLPYALIMTAVCLKCGLVPLYSWVPRAHGTPGSASSVSAILSGLHIKAGIYLFIRFQVLFSEVFVTEVFLVLGILTGIAGFIFAIAQKDVKLILAYHTVSQIGMIIIGLSVNDIYSYTGALYHVVSHALFKAALFMCVGIITKMYGTRNIDDIHGVMRRMPLVGATIIMATLGITGAPFFNGSISKYFISTGADWFVNGVIIFINLGTIISFVKFSAILGGKQRALTEAVNDSGEQMALKENAQTQEVSPDITDTGSRKVDKCNLAAALILGILCLAGGIFGESAIDILFDIQLEVNGIEYLQKVLLFAASLIAGYFIYKYYVKSSKLLARLSSFDIGFRGICASMGGVLAMLLLTAALL